MSYKIDDVFSAIADSNRRKILMLLAEEELTVNSITEEFKMSRPAISKHLKVLLKTNLVIPRQEGRERYYSLNVEPLNQVRNWLKLYDKFWDNKLNALKSYVENKSE
jgi:DNA-binding transcriptional ArsR family regulator